MYTATFPLFELVISKLHCLGDSGGGLMSQNTEGQWFILGIVSTGTVHLLLNQFNLYTRDSAHRYSASFIKPVYSVYSGQCTQVQYIFYETSFSVNSGQSLQVQCIFYQTSLLCILGIEPTGTMNLLLNQFTLYTRDSVHTYSTSFVKQVYSVYQGQCTQVQYIFY